MLDPSKWFTLEGSCNPKNIKNLLIRGKSRVIHGWIKGLYNTPEGQYCAIGAIGGCCDCGYNNSEFYAAEYFLTMAIPRSFASRSVISYNDSPTTTKSDILNMFDLAIDLVDEFFPPEEEVVEEVVEERELVLA